MAEAQFCILSTPCLHYDENTLFMNIYLDLTEDFNKGGLRTIICSGQAVVLHRLAIMSKDGGWILREDGEALNHVLSILQERGAT